MDSVALRHHKLKEEKDDADDTSKANGHSEKTESPPTSPELRPHSPTTAKRLEMEQKDKAFVLEHNINLQLDVEHQIEILAVKKSTLPAWKVMFLGTLSGFWMALSGCFAYSVAGGIERNIVKAVPVLPKLMLALLAPVAMHFIVIFGGEFYSGNCMFMFVGYLRNRLTLRTLLINWASCFCWNLTGCVIGVWLFGYCTDLFSDEPQLSFIINLAVAKSQMNPWLVFLRAIPANFMICLSIQMGISARDMLGKIIVLHMPLTVYTVAGFEHAIGNLVIFPLGLMYGADASVWSFIWNNLVPAVIGNAIGGCMIGYIETLLFSWDQGLGNTNQEHNHTDARKRAKSRITLERGNKLAQSKLEATRREIEESMEQLQENKARLRYHGMEEGSPFPSRSASVVSLGGNGGSPNPKWASGSMQNSRRAWGDASSFQNSRGSMVSARGRGSFLGHMPPDAYQGDARVPQILERFELSVDDGIRGGSMHAMNRQAIEEKKKQQSDK
uniref:Formate/nitrite transporter n=1 Tax=Hemiselmis tepida TaxID=464990 RepID=A0A7S0WA65_9CRYP|mmetsp:Transcript_34553/g.88503  ORF Transcript_34553/g.88503 Transcript_34553/m.88503 type:complete len:500 (+) Transcript_34553:68-1567(+)